MPFRIVKKSGQVKNNFTCPVGNQVLRKFVDPCQIQYRYYYIDMVRQSIGSNRSTHFQTQKNRYSVKMYLNVISQFGQINLTFCKNKIILSIKDYCSNVFDEFVLVFRRLILCRFSYLFNFRFKKCRVKQAISLDDSQRFAS